MQLDALQLPARGEGRRTGERWTGPESSTDGIEFRLWAPAAEAVWLRLEGSSADRRMTRADDGWHVLATDAARVGSRYHFRLADGSAVPDPASRFQPFGVHGPSEVVDVRAYHWRDGAWKNHAWRDAVLYELHLGTFTEQGTFRAAIEKLDHLVALGITGINLMPVAQFPGTRNWGYDGIFLFAPACSYGAPDDLKALVDAAHQRGLMVILDVVYSHFGPEGNLLSTYAPQFFTNRHQTPWGDAVNFDGPGREAVRNFVIQNALYWLEEFHFDGLRLDAVHAIFDDSPVHILEDLAAQVRSRLAPRLIHLIVENEANQASLLSCTRDSRPSRYTAQWNDDVHHVLHTALTGETASYYADFKGDTEKLGRALAEGFAFQGQKMSSSGQHRGQDSTALPPVAFVSFLQNHDQIGNRPTGDRIHSHPSVSSVEALRAAAAVYLLLPQIPMLFMGEEWATTRPFPFFCDLEGATGERVQQGRHDELSDLDAVGDDAGSVALADPQSPATFARAKLDWTACGVPPHSGWLAWYRTILAVRRQHIVPLLEQITRAGSFDVLGRGALVVRYALADSRHLVLVANLSDTLSGGCPSLSGEVVWNEGPPIHGGIAKPWSVSWSIEDACTPPATKRLPVDRP